MDNRQTIYIDFSASEDKVLSIDGTIAQNEDFDAVFTGKTFPGEVSVALWNPGERKLLWYATGTAETVEGGCALRKLRASTQELQEYFERGDAFMRALLTVGSHPEDGEWQDYGVGYVRLYVGTNPEEAPPPVPIDQYWTDEQTRVAIDEAVAKHNGEATAHADIRKAIDTHADRVDNPHRVTAAQAGALAKTGCNQLTAPVRLIRKDGSANPVLLIGSQLNGEGMKEDRWTLALHYDRLVFRTTPGGEVHTLLFNRPGDDKAGSDAIVLWKELVAALADATEGFIGADGGTVDGILRMKNPKVAADDNPEHDIALVPNANGQGLQVQFPDGSTAMIRMKTGTLATVAELNAAIETIELTPGPKGDKGDTGPQGPKGDPGEDATVAIDTTMPEAPTDDHVPSTQLLKELLAGYLKLSGGTEQAVNGNVIIKGRLYVNELWSGGAAQFFQVVASAGFNLLNINKLIAWGNKPFMENRIDGVYLTAKSITEGGTPIADKYAAKAETYSKDEVDQKITSALGDILTALAAI